MHELDSTEELDFHYLLSLLRPMHDVKEFAWLPELLSIVGYESLIRLCKYAGGETIKIPTLYQLSDAIDALQGYYDVYVKQTRSILEIPANIQPLIQKIKEVFDAG